MSWIWGSILSFIEQSRCHTGDYYWTMTSEAPRRPPLCNRPELQLFSTLGSTLTQVYCRSWVQQEPHDPSWQVLNGRSGLMGFLLLRSGGFVHSSRERQMVLVTFSIMLPAGPCFRTFLSSLGRDSSRSRAPKPCGLVFRSLPRM